MNKRSIIKLLSIIGLCLMVTPMFTGCALIQKNPTAISALAKNAAWVGTSLAIQKDPFLRPKFVLAQQSLQTLLLSGKVDGAAISQILASLPVDSLESQNAKIAIAGGTALFDLLVGERLDISKAPNALLFATGLNDGLKAALGL